MSKFADILLCLEESVEARFLVELVDEHCLLTCFHHAVADEDVKDQSLRCGLQLILDEARVNLFAFVPALVLHERDVTLSHAVLSLEEFLGFNSFLFRNG